MCTAGSVDAKAEPGCQTWLPNPGIRLLVWIQGQAHASDHAWVRTGLSAFDLTEEPIDGQHIIPEMNLQMAKTKGPCLVIRN